MDKITNEERGENIVEDIINYDITKDILNAVSNVVCLDEISISINNKDFKGRDYKSDAKVAQEYLIDNGIPCDGILKEEKSTITQENLENAKDIMDSNKYQTALIVSDPSHMRRSMLLAKDTGIKAYSSPTKTSAYKSLRTKIPFIARETFFYIGYKWYRYLYFK